ncbi:MAG TPA: tetratricopeptide repeat protein [Lacipirellulaceae bacterium]|nr:tetratricopeptide repeat protein [Lacipirellulaceae bacterium]
MSGSTFQQQDASLAGRRVMLIGKLASMPRREVEQIIRAHGGVLVERSGDPDLIVVSDAAAGQTRSKPDRERFDDELRERFASGETELLGESALWARLGLIESGHGVERLYTLAMLAELVRAPITAVRQWHRRGAILAKREVQHLPYFDFEEVGVARKLAQLLEAGCTITAVNRQLNRLSRLLPGVARPLVDPAVVVEGRCLYVRRDEGLSEAGGQLLIDFDGTDQRAEAAALRDGPATIPLVAADTLQKPSGRTQRDHPHLAEDLRALAAELGGAGHPDQAVDAYRAVLFSGDATSEDHFAVAELLYEQGELSAARERYYVAIELDEDFVEARANLGCVLAELGELALAEAAFRGALEYHPDYADAHYHLARLLDRENRSTEAVCHWRLFMSLAPASPWADEARERVGAD